MPVKKTIAIVQILFPVRQAAASGNKNGALNPNEGTLPAEEEQQQERH